MFIVRKVAPTPSHHVSTTIRFASNGKDLLIYSYISQPHLRRPYVDSLSIQQKWKRYSEKMEAIIVLDIRGGCRFLR
jgi:hypothetical protein